MPSGRFSQVKSALIATGLVRPAYRLHEWLSSRRGGGKAQAADGVPLPSPYLMQVVAGHSDPTGFLESGRAAVEEFAALFMEAGVDFASAGRVLDFGCGCGRMARHLPALTSAEIYGVDYNQRLVSWCAQNLKGSYSTNSLTPPLRFPDEHFDALYALSVFTHLRRKTQELWLAEIERVLKPGGAALITFHDEHHFNLPVDIAQRLPGEGLVVRNDALEGSNLIATFQSWADVRVHFGRRFDIAVERVSTATTCTQAAVVLRKRVVQP